MRLCLRLEMHILLADWWKHDVSPPLPPRSTHPIDWDRLDRHQPRKPGSVPTRTQSDRPAILGKGMRTAKAKNQGRACGCAGNLLSRNSPSRTYAMERETLKASRRCFAFVVVENGRDRRSMAVSCIVPSSIEKSPTWTFKNIATCFNARCHVDTFLLAHG